MHTSSCHHFVLCVLDFFKETRAECIQGMEAVPITDEKGKRERGKEKPATQESSWNSPQLPNMTEESQRWLEEEKKTDSVQCYLPADWNKSKGKSCPVQRVLQPKEAPWGHCCRKLSIYGNLADGFTLYFRGLFPTRSSCEVSVGMSSLVAERLGNQSLAQGMFQAKTISTHRAAALTWILLHHRKHRTELHLFFLKQ